MTEHDKARLERFSDRAGESVARTDRGSRSLSRKHAERVLALKAELDAERSRHNRRELAACA